MSDIFISHVEEDAEVALEIASGLEETGYKTWCFEVDSKPGPSYLIQTGKAVAASKAVVLLISPHSIGSYQVTKEIVRAHESGKHFVPILQDITHTEFQSRQPEWREAVGAATSISLPRDGVAAILPRIIDGLNDLNIYPNPEADKTKVTQIRRVLAELTEYGMPEKAKEMSVPSRRLEVKTTAKEMSPERVIKEAIEIPIYSTTLRWVSGGLALFGMVPLSMSIEYYVEFRLVGDLIISIIDTILVIAYLAIAFIPYWVSTKFNIRLDKKSVFGTILGALSVIFIFVDIIFSPIF